jgi:hypothetical protein
MKNLFNGIPQSEKQRILEMHGIKREIISEQTLSISSFPTGSVHTVKDTSGRVFTLKVRINNGRSLWGSLFLGSRETVHDENFYTAGRFLYYYKGADPVYLVPFKSSTKKSTKPAPTKPTQACPNQKGIAKELFKGSDVNLYKPGETTPSITNVCIDEITKLEESNTLKADYTSRRNTFVLKTNKSDFWDDTNNKSNLVNLYFECGSDVLKNDNEETMLFNISTAMGSTPVAQPGVTQQEVIKRLNTLCSTNIYNKKVEKTQDNSLSSTQSSKPSDVA